MNSSTLSEFAQLQDKIYLFKDSLEPNEFSEEQYFRLTGFLDLVREYLASMVEKVEK